MPRRAAGRPAPGTGPTHAAARGAVAAMAMSGMRSVTTAFGLVGQTPPQAVAAERAPGLVGRVPASRRRGAVELAHWVYGAAGGVVFALLPRRVRSAPWAGPVYGLGLWLAFEAALAPVLGLRRTGQRRTAERAALAGDHVLYGLVLAGIRGRPGRCAPSRWDSRDAWSRRCT